MPSVALILSTYNQPAHLDRSLLALGRQSYRDLEIIVADDGSGEATRDVVGRYRRELDVPVRHVWQEDRGFRKTRILNKAILATTADYLVFIDGDCVAHPDFIREHLTGATPGCYVNGSLIRLGKDLTERIDRPAITAGDAFRASWLTVRGRSFNRRYLRFSLGYPTRTWLNRHSRTKLYWLGANSSCSRADALAVNGFDNRFTYGFEDGDFGNRLENYGVLPSTVRWTANVLHLYHDKPWSSPEIMERNRAMMTPVGPGGDYRAEDGLVQVGPDSGVD